MSARTSSIPSEPGTRPIAPALDTADTSAGLAMKPIGACRIGMSTPSSAVTRLAKGMGRQATASMRRLFGADSLRSDNPYIACPAAALRRHSGTSRRPAPLKAATPPGRRAGDLLHVDGLGH